jgi:hypothetical protein
MGKGPYRMSDQVHTEEYYKKLTEHANKLALKKPDLNLLRNHPTGEYPIMAQALETLLQERNAKRLLVLPNLTAFSNDTIGVFSDYSGEDHSARYLTYSVLVCGYRYTGAFSERMRGVRETYKLGDKEIAFKDFGMGQIQASLGDYLDAANWLPGFLCTMAVDKRIATLFGALNDPSVPDMLVKILEDVRLGGREPREVEKLLRIVHMVAYLIALLGVDGQKILWMSDHDAICANPKQHESMMAVLQWVLAIYSRPGVTYPLLGGALSFKPRSIEMNDLLSLSDVVAGSIAQYLTKSVTERKEDIILKPGAEKVVTFLAGDGVGLKKAVFLIRLNTEGNIEFATMNFSLVNPPVRTFVPIYD